MDILAFALTDEYAPFTISFILMCGIGLIEAVGLGLGSLDLDAHVDAHADGDASSPLHWLGLGDEMPILIWLTSLLACFTIVGFGIQQACEAVLGAALSWPLATAAAVPAALVLNFFAANALHRIMPRTETTAISPDQLVGRRGTMVGTAAPGRPARARIVDQHGQAHYVPVLPHHDQTIPEGNEVLLVKRENDVFHAITNDEQGFKPVI